MYSILMDSNTKSYFMNSGEVAFHAYSTPAKLEIKRKNTRLVQTDMDNQRDLETAMYNAGFFHGYVDGKKYQIMRKNIYYFDRNPNDILYAQWLLTKDNKYLTENLKKNKLITLCQIKDNKVYFPTIETDEGEKAVLTYTDRLRIPIDLLKKYDGWTSVDMTFDIPCIVNGKFFIE